MGASNALSDSDHLEKCRAMRMDKTATKLPVFLHILACAGIIFSVTVFYACLLYTALPDKHEPTYAAPD